MFCAATSGMVAELVTTPFAVLIVRLQISAAEQPTGIVAALSSILRKEGVSVLYQGSSAALLRTLLISGIGVGLYPTARQLVCGEQNPSTTARFLVAASTGCVAAVASHPFDVVKVRMQSSAQNRSFSGQMGSIMREEGIAGYGRGLGPSLARAVIQYGTTVGTYDSTKAHLVHAWELKDGLSTHVLCSLLSGVVTALLGTPVDVVNNEDQRTNHRGPMPAP